VPLEEKRNPKNIVDGQFSMPFCAAIAAKNGSFVWDDYKNSLTDKDTLSLCKRIKTTHDKKAEECSPEYMSANVKIKVNGKDHERFIKIPKGDPENFMTQDEFIEKFDGLVEPYLTPKKSDELKNFMLKLDNANSIGSLFELSN
jgi:2-methylcitrate dehydratase PrpD